MRAAVDDVHHRHRHLHAAHAAEVAVQRQARFLGGGACHGHRHGERRVGAAQAALVGAVEVEQRAIQEGLFARVQAQHGLGDLGVDVPRPRARPCPGSGPCRRRASRWLRASRWTRPMARPRGPWCRFPAARRIRTVGLPRLSRISRPTMSTMALIADGSVLENKKKQEVERSACSMRAPFHGSTA